MHEIHNSWNGGSLIWDLWISSDRAALKSRAFTFCSAWLANRYNQQPNHFKVNNQGPIASGDRFYNTSLPLDEINPLEPFIEHLSFSYQPEPTYNPSENVTDGRVQV